MTKDTFKLCVLFTDEDHSETKRYLARIYALSEEGGWASRLIPRLDGFAAGPVGSREGWLPVASRTNENLMAFTLALLEQLEGSVEMHNANQFITKDYDSACALLLQGFTLRARQDPNPLPNVVYETFSDGDSATQVRKPFSTCTIYVGNQHGTELYRTLRDALNTEVYSVGTNLADTMRIKVESFRGQPLKDFAQLVTPVLVKFYGDGIIENISYGSEPPVQAPAEKVSARPPGELPPIPAMTESEKAADYNRLLLDWTHLFEEVAAWRKAAVSQPGFLTGCVDMPTPGELETELRNLMQARRADKFETDRVLIDQLNGELPRFQDLTTSFEKVRAADRVLSVGMGREDAPPRVDIFGLDLTYDAERQAHVFQFAAADRKLELVVDDTDVEAIITSQDESLLLQRRYKMKYMRPGRQWSPRYAAKQLGVMVFGDPGALADWAIAVIIAHGGQVESKE